MQLGCSYITLTSSCIGSNYTEIIRTVVTGTLCLVHLLIDFAFIGSFCHQMYI